MSDDTSIANRLRAYPLDHSDDELLLEAADELERLSAIEAAARNLIRHNTGTACDQLAELLK